MKNIRYFIAWLVLLALSPSIFASQNTRAPNTDIPPSAELTYTVKAEYNGLSLGGNSFIQWKADKQKYSLQNEARISLFGKILDADSNGRITAEGLVPEKYVEKRLRKEQTTTLFNYTDHTVTFRENRKASLREITQDRASIVWQLAFIASADPERLVPGSTLTFQVAGRSKIEPWTFHVVNTGDISTPMGKTKAIQFSRNGKKGQKMNVWLAPDHNWYPVQILFDEPGGLQLLQTIKKITPL
ncbi:DUF3108 domain-containing protein [Oxalobacter aliiformigenes]|uniref:DUF3108 domain-containing protein n=1 Tax=Oxalobacter aliiformigenes TaxID=2946593 RepID=A0A9E9LCD2_9BURK|nr:DUF3108 domain-containing protein [Oxalobacter aliiformigenes]WAV91548.1 DUF3108 domain-containing protein [Oxalobacter aliiformigenes]